MNRPKSQTKKTNAWEIGSFCFSLILLLLFINIIERDPDSFDDKGGKGTVFAFDSLFHLVYNIVREANALIRRRRNGRYFEFSHFDPSLQYIIEYLLHSCQEKSNFVIYKCVNRAVFYKMRSNY